MASSKGLKVMIAVDQSDHADYALKYYLDYLHRADNHLILIHNASIQSMAAMGIESLGQMNQQAKIWEDIMKKADDQIKIVRAYYDKILKEHDISHYNVHIIQASDIGASIVKSAADEDVQLIVMGTRGMGKLRRTILGSVSDYVIHHANCAVCVCHKPE